MIQLDFKFLRRLQSFSDQTSQKFLELVKKQQNTWNWWG